MLAVRKVTVLGALDASVRLYRERFTPLLLVSLVVNVPSLVLGLLVQVLQHRLESTDNPAQMLIVGLTMCGASVAIYALALVFGVIGIGVSTHIAAAAALGQPMTLGEAIRRSGATFGSLLGATLLVGLTILVGFLLCILPGLVAAFGLVFVAPVVVLERRGPVDSLKRAWDLAKDRFWKIVGAELLVGVLLLVVHGAIGVVPALLLPESLGANLATTFASTLAGAALQPLYMGLAIILYFDARVDKEAFDVQWLAAQAEGRDRPDGAVAPY